jgi:hypothetical protein
MRFKSVCYYSHITAITRIFKTVPCLTGFVILPTALSFFVCHSEDEWLVNDR